MTVNHFEFEEYNNVESEFKRHENRHVPNAFDRNMIGLNDFAIFKFIVRNRFGQKNCDVDLSRDWHPVSENVENLNANVNDDDDNNNKLIRHGTVVILIFEFRMFSPRTRCLSGESKANKLDSYIMSRDHAS